MAEQAEVADCVYWVDETDRPQDYFNAFDVFVLPSHYEGLPLVLVEAQTVGLPCIVSNAVTKEAALCGDHVKYLPLKQEAWVQEALWLYEHPERYDGKEAVAEAGYDIHSEAKRLQDFYEQTQV